MRYQLDGETGFGDGGIEFNRIPTSDMPWSLQREAGGIAGANTIIIVPYAGTESNLDASQPATVPTGEFVNRPA